MHRINKVLQQQINLNKTKNMLYAQLSQVIEVDPDFLAVLEELLESGPKSLSEPVWRDAVSFASQMLIKRLYTINQFMQVNEPKKRELENIYLYTWQRIVETKNIQATLRDYHYPALANWIASLYPQSFRVHLRAAPIVGQVICEEYSPQLQIDLLRLDLPSLKQPVLDIGCGSTASLTRHFRARGIEAYGIDRQIEKKEFYLQQMDWTEYRFEPNTWGTIVSNMAFTNHLHYVNNHSHGQLEVYLRKFKEILEALRNGGSFSYAPSVSFIEERLTAGAYRLERFEVVKEIHAARITKFIK